MNLSEFDERLETRSKVRPVYGQGENNGPSHIWKAKVYYHTEPRKRQTGKLPKAFKKNPDLEGITDSAATSLAGIREMQLRSARRAGVSSLSRDLRSARRTGALGPLQKLRRYL